MSLTFASRICALEAKVNQLLQGDTSEPQALSIGPRTHEDLCEKLPPSTHTIPQTSDISLLSRARNEPGECLFSDTDAVTAGLLTMEKANNLLDTSRTLSTARFPFVCIPHKQTAEELKQQKPFLFRAILAAASYEDMPLQRTLGKKVKQAISTRMILNGEIFFDILQGLVVYIAWWVVCSSHRLYFEF